LTWGRPSTRDGARRRADAPTGPATAGPLGDDPDVEAQEEALADDVVLDVRHLSVDYGTGPAALHAVRDVDLVLRRGQVLGIAGESGPGKSTVAYALTRILRPPGRVVAGSARYRSRSGQTVNVLSLSRAELRSFRWAELAIVFQSAMNALNPVLSLRAQIHDVLRAHRPQMTRHQRDERTAELLRLVGIPEDRRRAYAHELSGGMRQRAMIAVALALEPEIIVMDEPTTALDVVIQRQILDQVVELQQRLHFSVVFITHDLSLLIEIADQIAVMYAGRVVELAPAGRLYEAPSHPYSQGLIHSFPRLRGPQVDVTGIPGSPPDLRALPSGCAFRPRCTKSVDRCAEEMPQLRPVRVGVAGAGVAGAGVAGAGVAADAGVAGHAAACHVARDSEAGAEAWPR
jgi:oligopeptide/dipeptide ABC transporter ATP-binding protein